MEENKFQQYKIGKEIVSALTILGYMEPTPIQEQVIPVAMEGKDIIAKSQTGSGKTAAFAIPLCEKVDWLEFAPQALVLEPTRELAIQVSDEIFNIGRKKRLKVPAVFGGFPIDKQIRTLKQKNHIIVGTPGRIMDHLRRESLCLDKIKYFIIDEADLMLQMGFIDEVREIKEYLSNKPITMLFSATIGEHVEQLAEDFMTEPQMIAIESKGETVEGIVQESYLVKKDHKYKMFLNILRRENPDSAIIFCGTRDMVNTLFQKLKREGIKCGMLHGMLDQRERIQTIESYREGRFPFLIATDVAARGVDFENITIVFNYDFPTDKESYVHRIGRTARNGKTGKAISLVQGDEDRYLKAVEEYTKVSITVGKPLKEEEIREHKIGFENKQKEKVVLKKKKGVALNRNIGKIHIGGGQKSKMRAVDIVGTLCSIEGIQGDDIGIIDIRDSFTTVEILNGKAKNVLEILETKPIKGKIRKVRSYH